MESKYLMGAVYIIEQDYTDEEMRRDLTNMKNCGFNLITLWPVGNAWLAKSSHEWVFTKTRYVLDLCQELGMQAILQLFGQNQAQEFMPDSASTLDMEYGDQYGPWYNVDCMWANLNHPVVRDYFDNYFREAITALKDHPAVYGWDVFNEAHFRSDDPWTTRRYQNWLRKKYGTIQKLNKEWYRRYESFAQIRPEKRRAPYSIWSSMLPSLEYEKFRSENVTEICQFLYDTAKKYDTVHPIIIDGTSAAIVSGNVIMRNNDEFATAHVPDIYGSTFYPKSWGRNYKDTPWTLAMYYSIPAGAARKAGKPYLVNELQTHTQSVLTPGSEVSTEELTAWMLMCLFTGAEGMQLWRWRPFLHGYQSTGRGLTLMDGTPNERAEAVCDLMRTIRSHPEVFDAFRAAAPAVRIACSYDVRLYFDGFLKYGDAGQTFWAKNVEGWYKLFWNRGLNAEFTDLAHLGETEQQTPVMVLPGAIRVSEDEAQALCRYVEQGGLLIADGRMGAVNELACVPPEGIPGHTLTKLFGVVEIDVDSGKPMIVKGTKIPTGYQSQKLKLTDDATVLAAMEDGTPAVVLHRYGKGKTLYFNSFIGLSLLENLWPEIEKIVYDAVGTVAGITAKKDEHVHISCIEAPGCTAVLAVNFNEKPETVALSGLPEGKTLTELFTGATVATELETVLKLPASSHSIYLLAREEE